MDERGSAGRYITYTAWRERLRHASQQARALRPNAHAADLLKESTGNAGGSSAVSWSIFSASTGGSAPSSPGPASAHSTSAESRRLPPAARPSSNTLSHFTQRLSADEALIASVFHEFDELLLALRQEMRQSDSPSARVGEAQTLMHRATFQREVQSYLVEQQQALMQLPTANFAAVATTTTGPSSSSPSLSRGFADSSSVDSSSASSFSPRSSSNGPLGTAGKRATPEKSSPLAAPAAAAKTKPPAAAAAAAASRTPSHVRAHYRARLAQRQRNALCAEAQDYIAASRLWLRIEKERLLYAMTTTDDALAFGVLCVVMACGVLLKDELREEENPIPLSLYRRASKAFHRSRDARRQAPPSPAKHGEGSGRGTAADSGIPRRKAPDTAAVTAALWGSGRASDDRVCGSGCVESVLRAYPGSPIPFLSTHGRENDETLDDEHRGEEFATPAAAAAAADTVHATPSSSSQQHQPPSPRQCFLAWDDFPPVAHHRSIRLVHSLLAGLARTLERDFLCFEQAVNLYELAAVVLLQGVPQWMWLWSEDDEDDDDDDDVNSSNNGSDSGADEHARAASVSLEKSSEPVGLVNDSDGPDTRTPTPSACPSAERAASGERADSPAAPSGATYVRERLLSIPLAAPSRTHHQQQQQEEEPMTLFARMMQEVRRYEERCNAMSSRDAAGAMPSGRWYDSWMPSTHAWLGGQESSRTSHTARSGSESRGAARRASHVADYLQAASSTRVHAGSLFLYLTALKKAAMAAVVAGDDTRTLSLVNSALRTLHAEELARFDSLTCRERDGAVAPPGSSSSSGGASSARVRLPIVDHHRVWPRSVQEHVVFRLGTLHFLLTFQLSRFLLLLLVVTDEVGSSAQASAASVPSRTRPSTSGSTAKSTLASNGADDLASARAFADSPDSALDALRVLAAELADVERRGLSVGQPQRARAGAVATAYAPPPHGMFVLPFGAAATATGSHGASPALAHTGGRSSSAPFLHTASYAKLRACVLQSTASSEPPRASNTAMQDAGELSSQSDDEEVAPPAADSTAADQQTATATATATAATTAPLTSAAMSVWVERLVDSLAYINAAARQFVSLPAPPSSPTAAAAAAAAAQPPLCATADTASRRCFEIHLRRVEEAMVALAVRNRAALMQLERLRSKLFYPLFAVAPIATAAAAAAGQRG